MKIKFSRARYIMSTVFKVAPFFNFASMKHTSIIENRRREVITSNNKVHFYESKSLKRKLKNIKSCRLNPILSSPSSS